MTQEQYSQRFYHDRKQCHLNIWNLLIPAVEFSSGNRKLITSSYGIRIYSKFERNIRFYDVEWWYLHYLFENILSFFIRFGEILLQVI